MTPEERWEKKEPTTLLGWGEGVEVWLGEERLTDETKKQMVLRLEPLPPNTNSWAGMHIWGVKYGNFLFFHCLYLGGDEETTGARRNQVKQ